MKYIFAFLKCFTYPLNFSIGFCQFAVKKVQYQSKIISLFFTTMMVLFSSVLLVYVTRNVSEPKYIYSLMSSSLFGFVLFMSFVDLIFADFFPNSNPIVKNSKYFFNKLTGNIDVKDKSSLKKESSNSGYYIINNGKWNQMLLNLTKENILGEENAFLGFGSNFSGLKTQFAVLIYHLHDSKVICINNDEKAVAIFSKLFKVDLSPGYFSQVKGKFRNKKEVSVYDYIREEIQTYI